MSTEAPAEKKLPLVKLGLVAIVAAIGLVAVMRGLDYRGLAETGMGLIREAGPWVFFAAMIVLPAIGAPMMAFTILAGEAFAPQMGLGGVFAAVLGTLALNLALTYWLARYALRPVLTGLLKRYGYSVPKVTPQTSLTVALLVRLTPGPPYFLQGYILGLAEVPFRQYMVVSWLCMIPWAVGAVVLGRGVFNGNFSAAIGGIGVIAAAAIAVHFVRRKYLARES